MFISFVKFIKYHMEDIQISDICEQSIFIYLIKNKTEHLLTD